MRRSEHPPRATALPLVEPGYRTWRTVLQRYRNSSPEVQAYFAQLPALIEHADWEVALAFMFMRTERA